ncbi:MAG: hypothetical protein WD492_05070 [Alkalispirochaeta sp.]
MSNTDDNRRTNREGHSDVDSRPTTYSGPTADEVYRPQYEEDTISLIDLVAVVVRHRVLIIGGTFLAGLLVTALMYAGPMAGIEIGPQPVYTAEQRVLVNPLPPELQESVSVDIPTTVRTLLTNPLLVGEAYREFEDTPREDRSPEQYLTAIREDVIGKRYNVEWDSDTLTITLQYTNNSREHTVAFLDEILALVTPEVADYLEPRFVEAGESLRATRDRTREDLAILANDTLLQLTDAGIDTDLVSLMEAIDRIGGATLRSLADIERAIGRLEALSEDPSALLSAVGSPIVFEDTTSSRAMVVIISTITAFFLAVFLAFVLEYIRRVRHEPEEMAKLESAWQRK